MINGVGSQLIEFIKIYCFSNYPDFCRFLLIDAYNSVSILNFYQKNGFATVFSTEEQEKAAYKIAKNVRLFHAKNTGYSRYSRSE
ncbi:hypothetical protein FACS1894182_05650 [Bacteroidia bacterium]|nr:hypothetical protein FACS1894182_05650 [Bacteroidia bacterium]